MSNETEKKAVDRRSFFRGLGGAAAVAGAAASTSLGASPAVAAESQDEKTKARYKETDHVKAYYRTNRY